jgi:hypothetical protein
MQQEEMHKNIQEEDEFAILTNIIHKECSDLILNELKKMRPQLIKRKPADERNRR